MIVNCRYFSLSEKKDMQDGNFIPAEQKLLYICTEEDMMQFETVDKSDTKKIFWARESEVKFLEEVQEEWSEEKIRQRQFEIKGEWLTK
jgi:hypothetical protein